MRGLRFFWGGGGGRFGWGAVVRDGEEESGHEEGGDERAAAVRDEGERDASEGNRFDDAANVEQDLDAETGGDAGGDGRAVGVRCAFSNTHASHNEYNVNGDEGNAADESEFFADDDVREVGGDDGNDGGRSGSEAFAEESAGIERDERLKRLPASRRRRREGVEPGVEPGRAATGQGHEESAEGEDRGEAADEVERSARDGVEHDEERHVHQREHAHVAL